MNNVLRQAAGIDVAKDELVVSFSVLLLDGSVEHLSNRSFANNKKGFAQLLAHAGRLFQGTLPALYAMEATGVYYEALAYHLHDCGAAVAVVLPNKISNYIKTLEVKTITDQTASRAIAQFALERKVERWQRPSETYRRLRDLTRERDQVVAERTTLKNQLHARSCGATPSEAALKRLRGRITLLNEQLREIEKEIRQVLAQDAEVKQAARRLCSIRGVGVLTAATVLGETGGFALIRNKRQLVSYAGLDVKQKESGASVRGKTKISKRGNRYLRKALHLPALTAIRHDKRFGAVFVRLVARHGIKMKAVVAVQRKLLELCFVVWRKGQDYDPAYLKTSTPEPLIEVEQS